MRREIKSASWPVSVLCLAIPLAVASDAAAEQPSGPKDNSVEKDAGQGALAPSIAAAIQRDPSPEEFSTLEEGLEYVRERLGVGPDRSAEPR